MPAYTCKTKIRSPPERFRILKANPFDFEYTLGDIKMTREMMISELLKRDIMLHRKIQ